MQPAFVMPPETGYLSASDMAQEFGISRRAATKALERARKGIAWRGCDLNVQVIRGRGGCSGARYAVQAATLPPICGKSDRIIPIPFPEGKGAYGSSASYRISLAREISNSGPEGSAERSATIARLSATARHIQGKRAGQLIGERTLRAWSSAYAEGGILSGIRKRRADKGSARVLAWRAWDKAMNAAGVPVQQQEEIAGRLSNKVRSFWASGASSIDNIRRLMIENCRAEALAAGIELARSEMDRLCLPPANFVAEPKRRRARLAHIKRTDAGSYASNLVPRVRRHRDGLAPMEMVAADVRHSDIMVRRADGSLATPKMIAFLDLATNRMFSRIFLMPKGEMIRREHVLSTLRDLMADPSWGVPRGLYIDNGGEFKWGEAADDLARLAKLVRDGNDISLGIHDFDAAEQRLVGTIRSRPYNPQSKIIEGTFSTFTRSIEPMFLGFVGGNRMAKKVENQGHAPVPMKGDDAAIRAKFDIMVGYYNAKPHQRGHIAGKSPADAFDAALTDGWRAIVFDPREFELAFGKDERRMVQTGGEVRINNCFYRHDKLALMAGEPVMVRVPILGDGSRVLVLDGKGEPFCVASEDVPYGIHDLAGVREQDRRKRDLGNRITAETKGLQKLDLSAEMGRFVQAQVRADVPAPLANVMFNPVTREAAEAPAQPPLPQRSRASLQLQALLELPRRAG